MLVSVIVPSYNHNAHIVRALDSVLEQDVSSIEVCIIDDGSTDGSEEVINSWIEINKEKIKVHFNSRENKGLTKTLNELVACSKGKYLVALASDDFLTPNSIRHRLDEMENDNSINAVFGDSVLVDNKGQVVSKSAMRELYGANLEKYSSKGDLEFEIIMHWSVVGSSWMIKKDFLLSIGSFDESLMVEDWDLYLRLLSKGGLKFVDIPVAAYRVHGENVAFDRTKRVIINDNLIKTAKKNLSGFKGKNKILLFSKLFLLLVKKSLLKTGLL